MALSEYFNAQELANYAAAKLAQKGGMLWNELFPAKSIPSLDLSWVKAKNNNLKPLRAAALGEKAARRSPSGFVKMNSDLPFFREAMVVDEFQRQLIDNQLVVYKDKPEIIEQILENLFKEHAELIWGAYVNCDVMVGTLLTTGKIDFSSDVNDGRTNNYSYDYDLNGSWAENNKLQVEANKYWNSTCKAASVPLDDLLKAIDDQKEHGWNTAKILMNTSTFRGLCVSESITKAIHPLGGVVRRSEVKDLIEDETKCTLRIYDRLVNGRGNDPVNVIPNGKVCLLPEGELGNMCFAPTPEAHNKMLGKTEPRKDIAVMENGVTILTRAEDNPVDYETIVSATMLPSYPMMDAVYVLNTLAAS